MWFTFCAKSGKVASMPQIARNSVAATSCSAYVLWPTRSLVASAEPTDLVVASHGHSGQWEWSADRSLRLVSHQRTIAARKPKAFTFDAAADRRSRCSTVQRAWARSQPLESTQFTFQRLLSLHTLFLNMSITGSIDDGVLYRVPSQEIIDLHSYACILWRVLVTRSIVSKWNWIELKKSFRIEV